MVACQPASSASSSFSRYHLIALLLVYQSSLSGFSLRFLEARSGWLTFEHSIPCQLVLRRVPRNSDEQKTGKIYGGLFQRWCVSLVLARKRGRSLLQTYRDSRSSLGGRCVCHWRMSTVCSLQVLPARWLQDDLMGRRAFHHLHRD